MSAHSTNNIIIGLDLGISSTKAIALAGNKLCRTEIWEGTFSEKLLKDFIVSQLSGDTRVERIAATGIGSKTLSGKLLGYPVIKVDEFAANAASASFICDEKEFIVVSMGSGTNFVHITPNGAKHIGGSALGGGTILGLFSQMFVGGGWPQIRSLAERGSLDKIDLYLKDVSTEPLPGLPLDTTVTNFGKVNGHPAPHDLALGLINMVLQNIGVMAYLAGSGRGIKNFVLIGRLATLPHTEEIFGRLNTLYGVKFILSKQAAFMTAIGAAITKPN